MERESREIGRHEERQRKRQNGERKNERETKRPEEIGRCIERVCV